MIHKLVYNVLCIYRYTGRIRIWYYDRRGSRALGSRCRTGSKTRKIKIKIIRKKKNKMYKIVILYFTGTRPITLVSICPHAKPARTVRRVCLSNFIIRPSRRPVAYSSPRGRDDDVDPPSFNWVISNINQQPRAQYSYYDIIIIIMCVCIL